jgi:hypothetical protein
MICAVGHELFDASADAGDANPNRNPLCGRRIRISRDFSDPDPDAQGAAQTPQGLVSVDVVLVDRCTACKPTDLDLAPAAYGRLAPESKGRVVGQWHWLD